jgi:hypothetical protein
MTQDKKETAATKSKTHSVVMLKEGAKLRLKVQSRRSGGATLFAVTSTGKGRENQKKADPEKFGTFEAAVERLNQIVETAVSKGWRERRKVVISIEQLL